MPSIKIRALVVGALALALAGIATSPAHAVPAPDGQVQVLAFAGSDTTEDVMDALTAGYRGDATNPDNDNTVNIPVLAVPDTGETFTVPGDGSTTCGSRTYINETDATPPTTFPAPNGSGDGKLALPGTSPFPANNLANGCIDGARSSSGPAASDPAEFEYYAFALDAVSWAHFNGSAPDSLTLQQIRNIYNCTTTNWNQVGGTAGSIIRYVPQDGSGTRSFFFTTVLGFDPTTVASCAGQPAVKVVQENDGSAVVAADRPNAILPYSVAQWIAQGNQAGGIADIRGGSLIGQQGGQNPVVGTTAPFSPNETVIREGATFVGVRPVFNILDTRSASYGQAKRFAGTDAAGRGYLCINDGEAEGIMRTFGFTPFGNNIQTGICRVS